MDQRDGEGHGTPLAELPLSAQQIRRLAALRITTVEELAALCDADEARARLAAYAGMSQHQVGVLLGEVGALPELGVGESPPHRHSDLPPESSPTHTPQEGQLQEGAAMPSTPLNRLSPQPLSSQQIARLKRLGMTTAEELLAMAAVPASRKQLADYLQVSARSLSALLAKVRAQLPRGVAAEMERSVAGGHRRGVLDPIPPGKRRGR